MSAKTSAGAPRAYLIKGNDDFRKQRELDRLLASLVKPEMADFDLEQLSGHSLTAERVVAGLHVPPFTSKQRVVLVRHANRMESAEQEILAKRLPSIPETGCLILIGPAPEKVDGKLKKGSEVIDDLSRAVRKVGKVITVGGERQKDREAQAKTFIQSLLAGAGKKIEPSAVTVLLGRVGTDFSVLNTEVQKLIAYAGKESRITRVDVTNVTSESPEERIFGLVNCIVERKAAEALKLLDEHFRFGDSPDAEAPRALAMIARQFRLVWQARMLFDAGVRDLASKEAVPEKLRSALPAENNVLDLVARQYWQAERLSKQARAVTRESLAEALDAIGHADAQLKGLEGGVDDPRAVIELLVIRLVRPPAGQRAMSSRR